MYNTACNINKHSTIKLRDSRIIAAITAQKIRPSGCPVPWESSAQWPAMSLVSALHPWQQYKRNLSRWPPAASMAEPSTSRCLDTRPFQRFVSCPRSRLPPCFAQDIPPIRMMMNKYSKISSRCNNISSHNVKTASNRKLRTYSCLCCLLKFAAYAGWINPPGECTIW